jgi:hypothetical protein
VAHGGLVAAVSPVPAATFDEAPLNEFVADLPRLTPYAVRHEEAMRALLPAASALVPMTFGAVYRDEASVRAMLAARTRELQGYLDRVRGCYEWGLKVYRDAARWQASAAVESAELLRLAAEAAQATPGRAYLLRKQRERQVAAESDRLAAEALDGITARLGAASFASRRDVVPPRQADGVSLVCVGAFLVNVAATDAFRAAAQGLAAEYAPRGLQVELSGPWAPYSFVGDHDASA